MRRTFALLSLMCLVPGVCAAQGYPAPDSKPVAREPAPLDVNASAGLGWAHDSAVDSALAAAVSASARYQMLEAGLLLEHGRDTGLGGTYMNTSVMVGLSHVDRDGLRGFALGFIGRDSYSGVGCGVLCQGGGASASLPVAGVRVGGSYAFGRADDSSSYFVSGLALSYGHHLTEREVAYSKAGGAFGGTSGTQTFGGSRFSVLLTAGFVVDALRGQPRYRPPPIDGS